MPTDPPPTPDPWATLLHFLSTSVFRYDPAMSERVLGMIAAARAAVERQHQQQVASLTAQLQLLARHVHGLFPMDSQLPDDGQETSFIIHTTNHLKDSWDAAIARVAALDPTHHLRDVRGSK